MRVVFVWWFILLLAAATACTKNTEEQRLTEYIIPKEAADYLVMPNKGFFIYRDSATGQLDSVVVEDCSIVKGYQPQHTVWSGSPLFGYEKTIPAYHYEYYTLKLWNHTRNTLWQIADSDDDWYETGPTTAGSISVMVSGRATLEDGFIWGGTIFYYPPSPGMSDYKQTYSVEGKTYRDVLLAKRDGELFYWAKGVGIIKRVIKRQYGKTYTSTLVRRGSV